ncbi:hypothetical protein K469DRAFT_125641 [Zopfia rhizophila CBS 207.26]|uniref:Uncharacterized protein n=1 Tax=Zopfia rhizophila CBS 207.26 TaxID=1314779 RepID=A0A6A6E5I7_9PEZI|nr:hypothetical protein K469DRAFT_125641 [Zopfia rhizophila CBS 207.26]
MTFVFEATQNDPNADPLHEGENLVAYSSPSGKFLIEYDPRAELGIVGNGGRLAKLKIWAEDRLESVSMKSWTLLDCQILPDDPSVAAVGGDSELPSRKCVCDSDSCEIPSGYTTKTSIPTCVLIPMDKRHDSLRKCPFAHCLCQAVAVPPRTLITDGTTVLNCAYPTLPTVDQCPSNIPL